MSQSRFRYLAHSDMKTLTRGTAAAILGPNPVSGIWLIPIYGVDVSYPYKLAKKSQSRFRYLAHSDSNLRAGCVDVRILSQSRFRYLAHSDCPRPHPST